MWQQYCIIIHYWIEKCTVKQWNLWRSIFKSLSLSAFFAKLFMNIFLISFWILCGLIWDNAYRSVMALHFSKLSYYNKVKILKHKNCFVKPHLTSESYSMMCFTLSVYIVAYLMKHILETLCRRTTKWFAKAKLTNEYCDLIMELLSVLKFSSKSPYLMERSLYEHKAVPDNSN